jgi:hypothetical protein
MKTSIEGKTKKGKIRKVGRMGRKEGEILEKTGDYFFLRPARPLRTQNGLAWA